MTLTASVAVQGGSGPVGGTVEFRAGGAAIAGCAAQPVDAATGDATCTTSALGAGTHASPPRTAGTPTSSPAPPPVAALTVASAPGRPGPPRRSRWPPPRPPCAGQAATFTAVVAPAAPGAGTPTGTVTFYDGDKSLGTAQLAAVGGAFQATLSAGGLAVGPHTITARYGGDGGFLESASAARTHHVNTDLSAFPRLPGGAYNLKRGAGLAGGSFVGVSLAGASLIGADLTGAVLTGADLTGANLSSADLRGADLSAANLRGATGLQTATLTGAVWGTTTCPDGTTSDQNGGTCLGHLSAAPAAPAAPAWRPAGGPSPWPRSCSRPRWPASGPAWRPPARPWPPRAPSAIRPPSSSPPPGPGAAATRAGRRRTPRPSPSRARRGPSPG